MIFFRRYKTFYVTPDTMVKYTKNNNCTTKTNLFIHKIRTQNHWCKNAVFELYIQFWIIYWSCRIDRKVIPEWVTVSRSLPLEQSLIPVFNVLWELNRMYSTTYRRNVYYNTIELQRAHILYVHTQLPDELFDGLDNYRLGGVMNKKPKTIRNYSS